MLQVTGSLHYSDMEVTGSHKGTTIPPPELSISELNKGLSIFCGMLGLSFGPEGSLQKLQSQLVRAARSWTMPVQAQWQGDMSSMPAGPVYSLQSRTCHF